MQTSKIMWAFVQTLAAVCLAAPVAAQDKTAEEPADEPKAVEPPAPAPPPPAPAPRPAAPRPPAQRPRWPPPRPVQAEDPTSEMQVAKYVSLAGPRIGVSFLQGRSYKSLQDRIEGAHPFVTTLGWQFEHAWLAGDDGVAGLVEIVPSVSGFNQGLFIPGINALFGVRSGSGLEFGAGGQLNLVGGSELISAGALFAAGVTIHTKSLNFPIDLVWVSSQQSNRIGIVVGFSGVSK